MVHGFSVLPYKSRSELLHKQKKRVRDCALPCECASGLRQDRAEREKESEYSRISTYGFQILLHKQGNPDHIGGYVL